MTRLDVVVVAGIVAAVAFLCFTMGLLVRRSSDQDLIAELEQELDARQQLRPQEIAHEPALPPVEEYIRGRMVASRRLGPAWDAYKQQLAATEAADTTWDLPALRTPPQGFIALPDWHAPLEEVGIEEHVAAMGAELQEYVAALIAASQDA